MNIIFYNTVQLYGNAPNSDVGHYVIGFHYTPINLHLQTGVR